MLRPDLVAAGHALKKKLLRQLDLTIAIPAQLPLVELGHTPAAEPGW